MMSLGKGIDNLQSATGPYIVRLINGQYINIYARQLLRTLTTFDFGYTGMYRPVVKKTANIG